VGGGGLTVGSAVLPGMGAGAGTAAGSGIWAGSRTGMGTAVGAGMGPGPALPAAASPAGGAAVPDGGGGPAISLRGREQYCSGGAWVVGPAIQCPPGQLSHVQPCFLLYVSVYKVPTRSSIAFALHPCFLRSMSSCNCLPVTRRGICSRPYSMGPAPEWPRPPADATIAGADTSRVRPQHQSIVAVLTQKHSALASTAVGMRKKELDGISTKVGGMLVGPAR